MKSNLLTKNKIILIKVMILEANLMMKLFLVRMKKMKLVIENQRFFWENFF